MLADALPGQAPIGLIGFQIGQLSSRTPLKRPDEGATGTLEAMQMQQLNAACCWLLLLALRYSGDPERLPQAQQHRLPLRCRHRFS
jgi:hypothetical protein